ncbi:MAG: hypothetical protein NTV38_07080 [Chloroflexi bacterium]|nr:hypothetical protein [Chloroflexota bacterium]
MQSPNFAAPTLASPTPEHWAAKFFTIWIGQAFSLIGSALFNLPWCGG